MKILYKDIEENGLDVSESFSFSEESDNFSVDFNGHIDRAGDVYVLSGLLNVAFSCPCDRCLEEVHMDFSEKVNQAISPLGEYPKHEMSEVGADVSEKHGKSKKNAGEQNTGLTDAEAGMFVSDPEWLDTTEFLREEAILLVPAKRLCKPDCKGICPGCGAMLNIEPCRCGENKDSALSGLEILKNTL